MKIYTLRKQYSASKRVLSLFRTAFFLTTAGVLLELIVAIIQPEGTYTFGSALMTQLLFGLLFLTVATLVLAYFVLWVGMLHFLIKYDGSPLSRKSAWFIVCLFGLSFGAALYYWFVYRKFLGIAGLGQRPERTALA